MEVKEIKAKPISDIELVKNANVLLKGVSYDFKLDLKYDLYIIDIKYSNGKILTVGISEKFFNEHFSVVEPTLEEKYAKELAEVERLFPEGTEGTFKYEGNITLYCKRKGELKIDEYNGVVRISTNQLDSGLLWSTKHGYSIPSRKIEFEGLNDSLPNKPTFGEKLVSGSVPTSSSKLKADRLKSLFAEITDIVNQHSEELPTDILNKDYGIIQSSIYLGCLTEILKAQMLSVKFVTLSKD